MRTIDRNEPPMISDIEEFIKGISFMLPEGFLEFFEQANGADISSENRYTILWPITEMVQRDKDYDVEEYASDLFIFGSDGGDSAFAIERTTGKIFEMPFIGMSNEEAIFRANTFDEFLKLR
jgi:SMI1 / KNR4 family (SUKH-1)